MTNYQPVAYLDNAATTPIPDEVLTAVTNYYQFQKVNVHRGMYGLAHQVTSQYEAVREQVKNFIHATNSAEIVFTSGTTDGLNMVTAGYARQILQPGDEIMVSLMEHHSNLVPWQQVAQQTGAQLKYLNVTADGQIDIKQLRQQLTDHTKIVALTLVSNVLGTKLELAPVAELVHQHGGILVADAAQAAGHLPIDVQSLGVDFLAFSGHKMFGPTGIGVLYGRQSLLEQLQPVRFGGEMIQEVTQQGATWQPLPLRLEAGTPNIAGVLGLGAAINYLQRLGFTTIQAHEQKLMRQLMAGLQSHFSIQIYGSQVAGDHHGAVSFNFKQIHAHDVATILDAANVAVRAGQMCAAPLMQVLQTDSVVRASISAATTSAEVDRFLAALDQVEGLLL